MELQLEPKFNTLSRIYKHSEVIIVGILVAFYLFISNYYYWSATFVYGGGILALPTSGGSDPYYNFVAILHILTTHTQLVFDPTLNYPLGTTNPRNPFFHWFIVLVAEILSPFYGADQAAFYAFEEFDAVFGALLIIPVYLITKEIFGKNAAGVSALLYTLMPSNLSAGILSGGRMHTPELIFAFFAVYFFIKAIKLGQKTRIIENLRDYRTYHVKILEYFNANRIASIYALLASASLGGLMLSWQGYAYIEAILLIYVAVQLIVNLILKRPTGYLTFYTALFIVLGFLMGAYYYQALGEGPGWYNAEVLIGVVIVLFGVIIGIIGRRPWILIIPLLIIVVGAAFEGLVHFSPALLQRLLSGEGYFIKTRVYDTIAEAAAPQLGAYIGGFGIAQFLLGLTGVAYAVYIYFKEKTEELLFILVFSVVSIYMSFAAARFNITAAPAYAILGSAMLVFFAKVSHVGEIKKRKPTTSGSPVKAIRGNIKWLQALFVILITFLLVVPSATFMVSASVPYGSSAQAQVEKQIGSSIPSIFQTNNTTNFVGGLSGGISNGSTPLSKSLAWLSTQDSNVPIIDKPAYVSWWDYGFQQRYQGQHPTVADDFQQGIAIAGQTLLAQNNSQIISLFIARILESSYSNGNFTPNVTQSLIQYLGVSQYKELIQVSQNPASFKDQVLAHPAEYGQYISSIDTKNTYFAYVKGTLATDYSVSTLINLYQDLIQETGYNIKYIQVPTDNSVASLLPTSATNTGIFYAPAYLTYSPSYATSAGGVIPTEYYNIYANTDNGTYSLQNLPAGLIPTSYNIQYTPQFYNTSIYRFTVGLPPSAVGQSYGIPGIDYGTTQYTAMPAWNMSNFMLVYENIPYNPYKDYQAHPTAWTTIPLQQAYTYQTEGKGTVELLPPVSTLLAISDPIVAYYPGAIVHGQVTMPDGSPVPGVHVTIFDQYGIPHQVATTNSQGYYNITALPGNDTLYFSTGTLSKEYLIGSSDLGIKRIEVSNNQANRIATSYNTTTGLPDYYFTENLDLSGTSASGSASYQYQQTIGGSTSATGSSVKTIKSGTVTYTNSTYNVSYSAQINDGNYSYTNIPPLSYKISVTSGGRTYSDFEYANVTTGSNVVYNLKVPFDAIFANVSLYGHDLAGLSVTAVSGNGFVAGQTTTNQTGNAILWVTPGSYNLTLSGPNITSTTNHVTFTNWAANTSVSFTPVPSSSVSIGINGYSGQANVTLYSNGLLSNPLKLSLENGMYSGIVPIGVYTISVVAPTGAYLQTITLNSSLTEKVTLQPLSNFTLSSNIPGIHQKYAGRYEIIGQNSILQYSYQTDNLLSTIIPQGTYTISGVSVTAGKTYTGFISINLVSNYNYNLSLSGNNSLTSLVFNSASSPSYNTQSAVTNGLVLLKYGQTGVYYSTIENQGIATLYYPAYYTNNGLFSVEYIGSYYGSVSATVSSSQVNVPVTPRMSNIHVELNQSSLSSSTQYLLLSNPTTSQNLTLTSGNGSFSIPLGLYYARVYSPNSVIKLIPSYVAVNNVNISSYPLNSVAYSSVKVTNSQATTLYYLNGTAVGNTNEVTAGTYQVYAFNSSLGASLTTVYINQNTTLSPTYSTYYNLSLTNSAGYKGGTYTVSSGSNTINLSYGRFELPSGNYNIQYNYRTANTTGSFTYTGSASVSLTQATTVNLTLSKQTWQTNLKGYALYQGLPAQYARVMLVNSQGKLLASTSTNGLGYYTMSVPTGQYTLYITNNKTLTGYFSSITIPSFAAVTYGNASLTKAHFVSVTVNLGTTIVNNIVNVTAQKGSFAFYPVGSKLLLPDGNYTFASSVSKTETSSTGSTLTVSYSNSVYLYLNTNTIVPLTLNKVVIYSFKTTMKSPVASVSINGNLSYNFQLTNQGNNNETVTLSSPSSNWYESYNVTTVTLLSGQTVNLSLNATLKGNLEYGASTVPILVSYTGGTSSLSLPVNINKQLNYSISENGLPVYDGSKILIPVLLNNTGNAPITVNLSLNQTLLGLNGWNGSLQSNGSHTLSVYLPYKGDQVVYATLVKTVSQPVYPMTFAVSAQGNTTWHGNQYQNTSLTVLKPQSANAAPYPTGYNIIANYTGSPVQSLIIGIVIIAAAVVTGLAATAYRGRKK